MGGLPFAASPTSNESSVLFDKLVETMFTTTILGTFFRSEPRSSVSGSDEPRKVVVAGLVFPVLSKGSFGGRYSGDLEN